LVSATHRNLKQALADGRFRQDLFYRLQTIRIHLPPLRERKEDIDPLVKHFISRFNCKYEKDVRAVDPKVMRFFRRYHWPGNVRELERCIEHAFVFAKGPVIFAYHLPDTAEFDSTASAVRLSPRPSGTAKERGPILWALAQTGDKRGEAAALLGISRTSLWRRMREMNLA
jgi:transcriptional regulator with PAS, ATPase and Fis domain